MPGAFSGTRKIAGNKKDKFSHRYGAHILSRKTECKQIKSTGVVL